MVSVINQTINLCDEDLSQYRAFLIKQMLLNNLPVGEQWGRDEQSGIGQLCIVTTKI